MKKYNIYCFTLIFTTLVNTNQTFAQWLSKGNAITETGRTVYSIDVVNNQTLWAVTFDGVFYNQPTNEWIRTNDGGNSWTSGSVPFDNPSFCTYSVTAIDEASAWVSAGNQPSFTAGGIYKTEDGGQSWTEQLLLENQSVGEIIYWNEDEAFTHTFSRLNQPGNIQTLKTTDGGNTWIMSELPDQMANEEIIGFTIRGIIDKQNNHIWMGTSQGRVYHSPDRGASWEVNQLANQRIISGVAFANESLGLAVSNASSAGPIVANKAFRTNDSGTTWEEIDIPNSPTAGAIEYIPGTVASFIVSHLINGETNILITHDAGVTWKEFRGPGISAIEFISPTEGWVAGEISPGSQSGFYQFASIIDQDHTNVSTVAGNQTEGNKVGNSNTSNFWNPKGIAVDESNNFIYVTDNWNASIKKILPSGTTSDILANTVPDSLALSTVGDIIIDKNNNLIITEPFNVFIKKIDLSTNPPEVSIFAGTGVSGLQDGPVDLATFISPRSLCMDSIGNIYVGDQYTIRKIDTSGMVTTLAGSTEPGFADGEGSSARFNLPWGIQATPSGIVYVADAFNHAIRKVDHLGNVTTVAGNGEEGYIDNTQGTNARFSYPEDLAIDQNGNLFVVDGTNSVIRKIDTSGFVTTFTGLKYFDYFVGSPGPDAINGDGRYATFSRPRGIYLKENGNLLTTEWNTDMVREIEVGVPSLPFTVLESTIIQSYRISHIRQDEPKGFRALVQNISDSDLSNIQLRVEILKDNILVWSSTSEPLNIATFDAQSLDVTDVFSPTDTGTYDVVFNYLQQNQIAHKAYQSFSIDPHTMDYGDAYPYIAGSYADFFSQFQGNYGVAFDILTPDSITGISTAIFTNDSLNVQYSIIKIEDGQAVDYLYLSNWIPLDSILFDEQFHGVHILEEPIWFDSGKYLFVIGEDTPGSLRLGFDNDIQNDQFWIEDFGTGQWAPMSESLGFEDILPMIRPVFDAPQILTNVQEPRLSLPLLEASPNPFIDHITISLPTDFDKSVLVNLNDMSGQILDQFIIQPGQDIQKNWKHLPSGHYYLSIFSEGIVHSTGIIKLR